MNYEQIKELYLKDEIILEVSFLGKRTRNKYSFNENGEWFKTSKIEFDKFNYFARLSGTYDGYKINKKDYNQLIKLKCQNKKK
jgi:hypothetical protein